MLFSHTVTISRPADAVFSFLSEPANDPQWRSDCTYAARTSDGATGVGSTGINRMRLGPREADFNWQLVRYDVPTEVRWTFTDAPFEGGGGYTLRARDDGATEMTLHEDFRPSGFMKVALTLMRPVVARGVRRDLEALKRVLEADGSP